MNLPLKVQGERAWEGAHLILRIKNTFFANEKMTRNKLTMEKGAIFTVLLCTIYPYEHTRDNYPNMDRGRGSKTCLFYAAK